MGGGEGKGVQPVHRGGGKPGVDRQRLRYRMCRGADQSGE